MRGLNIASSSFNSRDGASLQLPMLLLFLLLINVLWWSDFGPFTRADTCDYDGSMAVGSDECSSITIRCGPGTFFCCQESDTAAAYEAGCAYCPVGPKTFTRHIASFKCRSTTTPILRLTCFLSSLCLYPARAISEY